MTAVRYVADATGVPRKIRYRFRCDAGGVIRKIKRRYLADAGGVPRLTYILGDEFSLSAGSVPGDAGYSQGGFGSLSPSDLLGDGNTFLELATATIKPFATVFQVISSGPLAANYIDSVTINGAELLASAAAFSGGSGGGTWTWTPGLSFTPGQTYDVLVIRN